MDESKKQQLVARAISLVHLHFELLNMGRLAEARAQLFFPPGLNEKPLDVYVEAMRALAPFQVLSLVDKRFEDVRQRRHGAVAVVWMDVVVRCALGEKATKMTVWWFPESDTCQISARPSEWVLEGQRGG